ncbi:MAG: hypothetical protein KOO63_09610 [Bacteroidales bacterium]|nr:hypothetical protein [Candidatus Latescibacterota bacterium]
MLDTMNDIGRYKIYDYLRAGVIVIDRDYSVIFWSRQIEDLTGIERKSAIATDLRVLIPSMENGLFKARIEKMFKGKDTMELSTDPREEYIPILTSDGKLLDNRVFLTSVPGKDRTAENIIFEFSLQEYSRKDGVDVSRIRKILKDETVGLVKSRTELEAEIKSRKETEKKLAEYSIELERANRSLEVNRHELEEIIHMASHDLKTPIVSIHGFANLLEERTRDCLDPKSHDYLERIVKSAVRMERLLSGFLEVSRIKSGGIHSEAIDMNELVEDVVSDAVKATGCDEISVIRPGKLPNVFGKRIRVRTLFAELIDNAIKYMPSREMPFIEIGFKRKAPADHNDGGTFYVRDNGEGVPVEYHERIFRMFEKVPVDNRRIEGPGAGLTMAKRIVELHGGEIWLESIPGTGSTFYFTLPLERLVT